VTDRDSEVFFILIIFTLLLPAEDGQTFKPSLISTLRKIQSGYLFGVR